MPRPADILRPTQLEISLPEDVRAQLDLYLFSEAEGCVPRGAYKRFFVSRLREFFGAEKLDLGDYTPVCPKGQHIIYGNQDAVGLLKVILK